VHERYRRQTTDRQTDRQTDGRATAYSEREREFTFAKNLYFTINGSTNVFSSRRKAVYCVCWDFTL